MENFTLYDCVTSTNDLLKKEAINGAKEGTVIVSLTQTDGRGRKGKKFISNKGGMYLSILLRPKKIDFDTTLITSMTAVAVCKSIEKITQRKTEIKWVNDILIDNKKVCGILCESGICENNRFIIVGIGLNYFCEDFSDEIKEIAGNIFKTYDSVKEKQLTELIIDNFFELYNSKDFFKDYKKRSIVIGKEVLILNKNVEATVIDIDNKCRLQVRYKDGCEELLSSGEISIKLKEL